MVVRDRGRRVVVVVVAAERVVQPAVVDEALEAAEVGEAVPRRHGRRVGGRQPGVHEARAGPEHVHGGERGNSSRAEKEKQHFL